MESSPAVSEKNLSSEKTGAILHGAMEEFLGNGYAATSMDRVAKAAKVSKATVYSHFQDKESLFVAIIRHLVEEKFLRVFDPVNVDKTRLDPEMVLRKLAYRMLDTADKAHFKNFMRVIIGESGRFPNLARAFITNIEKTGFRLLKEYFTASPEFEFEDPEAIARIFVGSLAHYIIVQEMLYGKEIIPMEKERLVENLVALLMQQRAGSKI